MAFLKSLVMPSLAGLPGQNFLPMPLATTTPKTRDLPPCHLFSSNKHKVVLGKEKPRWNIWLVHNNAQKANFHEKAKKNEGGKKVSLPWESRTVSRSTLS